SRQLLMDGSARPFRHAHGTAAAGMRAHAVTASLLGAVERLISRLDDLFGATLFALPLGHADADGYRNLACRGLSSRQAPATIILRSLVGISQLQRIRLD